MKDAITPEQAKELDFIPDTEPESYGPDPGATAAQAKPLNFHEILTAIEDTLTTYTDTAEGLDDKEMAELEALLGPELDDLAEMEQNKIDGLVFVIKKSGQEAEYLKKEAEAFMKRRKAVENKIQRLKDYIKTEFLTRDIKKIKGHTHTIFITERKKLEIFDFEKIPKKFTETETVINVTARKDAITEALVAGKEIPGARIIPTKSISMR